MAGSRRPKNTPYIYVRPDGTIEVRWTNPQTGKRITRIARDHAHAEALLVSISLPPPPVPPPPPPTLTAWTEQWRRLKLADGFDPITDASVYAPALTRVTAVLGGLPLPTITAATLAALWITLAQTPTPAGRPGYAPATIRLSRRVLRLCLADAVAMDLLPTNPVTGRVSAPPPRHLDVSAARAIAILAAVQGTPAEGPITLALLYGMRLGEILGLRWDAIDFEHGLITVRAQRLSDGTLRMRTKGGAERELPLLPQVEGALRGQKKTKRDSPYVFLGRGGAPLSRQGVRWPFNRALQEAGLAHVRIHDLRHMTTTLLARLGVDEPVRQAIVGHTSAQVHGLYRHVSRADIEVALGKLARLLEIG